MLQTTNLPRVCYKKPLESMRYVFDLWDYVRTDEVITDIEVVTDLEDVIITGELAVPSWATDYAVPTLADLLITGGTLGHKGTITLTVITTKQELILHIPIVIREPKFS